MPCLKRNSEPFSSLMENCEGEDGGCGGGGGGGGGVRRGGLQGKGERVRERGRMMHVFCGMLSNLAERMTCGKNRKRREGKEGVSLDCTTSQNGLVVRMLGDVKGSCSTIVETSLTPSAVPPSRSTDDWDTPPKDTLRANSSRRASTGKLTMSYSFDKSDREVEKRLPGGLGRCPYFRFKTLHRTRRKNNPTRHLEKQHQALLDDLYNGLTKNILSRVGVWGFNAFTLNSVSGGRPVSVLCVYLLHKYGLINHFKFDTVTVWKCFSLIEEGYHASNPYHNAIHAADVTQAMHCYLQEEKIYHHLTPLETLAALIAAVCHDLYHPGVNQQFLIVTDNHLAALYKNFSVLENHHWRCAMGCLWESGLLDSWSSEDVETLQEMLKSLILATDINRHREFIERFEEYLKDSFDIENPEHRHFSLQIALKCADICNPCRPWEVSQIWSKKICDEFYRQGDYERQRNLPVTKLCDREKMSVARIQKDFIEYVVSPLFAVWNSWLKTSLSKSMVDNMNINLKKWEEELYRINTMERTCEAPDSPEKQLECSEEEAGEMDVDGGVSPSSSGDSHQSVLGSLENVSRSLELGRRHSVPVNMPCVLPRTIFRRESLPEDGDGHLVIETVTIGKMSSTSLSSQPSKSNCTLTADFLLPEPSVTAMGTVGPRLSRPSPRLTRRKSLPPLWLKQTRTRVSHLMQPLSPTPSEDVSPNQNTQENFLQDGDNAQRLGTVCSVGLGPSCENTSSGCSGSAGCDRLESTRGDSIIDTVKQTHHPLSINKLTSTQDSALHGRQNVSNQSATTFLHSDILDNYPYRSLLGRGLVRRASLDSTSINSKRDFFTRADRTKSELDKENLVPREPPPSYHREQQHSWKTRAWRSLNCDEENVCEKQLKPGIYRLNHSQGNLHAHGRRGSAPVLRPEELLGGLRGGAERPDYHYLSVRRGSAPSHPNQKGCDIEGELGVAGHHTPLTSKENLLFDDFITTHSRLTGRRRGSIPFDHRGSCMDGSDVCAQSPGGVIPTSSLGTTPPPSPSPPPPPPLQTLPHTLHRRGSLPTDLFRSVCGIMRGRSHFSVHAQRFRLSPIILTASSANPHSHLISTPCL